MGYWKTSRVELLPTRHEDHLTSVPSTHHLKYHTSCILQSDHCFYIDKLSSFHWLLCFFFVVCWRLYYHTLSFIQQSSIHHSRTCTVSSSWISSPLYPLRFQGTSQHQPFLLKTCTAITGTTKRVVLRLKRLIRVCRNLGPYHHEYPRSSKKRNTAMRWLVYWRRCNSDTLLLS